MSHMYLKLHNKVIFSLTQLLHSVSSVSFQLTNKHVESKKKKTNSGRTEQMLFHEAKKNTGFVER